jgi:hypothetical protein
MDHTCLQPRVERRRNDPPTSIAPEVLRLMPPGELRSCLTFSVNSGMYGGGVHSEAAPTRSAGFSRPLGGSLKADDSFPLVYVRAELS